MVTFNGEVGLLRLKHSIPLHNGATVAFPLDFKLSILRSLNETRVFFSGIIVLKVYMTHNFLSPSWKDLLKQYNNFFCSFSFSFF